MKKIENEYLYVQDNVPTTPLNSLSSKNAKQMMHKKVRNENFWKLNPNVWPCNLSLPSFPNPIAFPSHL